MGSALYGALAALELHLLIGGVVRESGRRLDLVLGPAHATARVPGCDCFNVYGGASAS